MFASERSPRADELHSLLISLSQKLSDLPAPLKGPLEEDIQKIQALLDPAVLSPSEKRYRELAESINDGFFELDQDWRFTYINQRAANNAGYRPEDLIGKRIWETFPQILGTPQETNYRRVLAERQPTSFETTGANASKAYIIRVYPSVNGITVFWIDITERKQVEEALVRSNQKISEILSSISDDFYVLDRDWKFVYANKQFAGKLGRAPEDFIGNSAWDMFPKHIGSMLYENFHASMEKGEIRRFEFSGQYTDAWYSVTSFPSAEGITVLGSDITERVRAEEEIRKLLTSVEQEKARLQSVINNIPDEVWFVDASGNLVLVNEQVLKVFGPEVFGGQEAAPRRASDVAATNEVYLPDGTVRQPNEAPPLRALRGEYVQDQEEIVRIPATGELRYRQVNAAPVRGPDGAIIGSVSVVRDITEIRNLEKERVEALTQITVQRKLMEQREKDRQAIARDLHDGPIQTLSSSLFQLHMVKEAFPDPSLQTELDLVGQDIKNSIHELRDVLNELRPPALIQFGLTKVIRMFLEDFKTRFSEIEVEVELTEQDQRLSNDAHLTLFRIFQAGMNNVVRHSEASKVWVVFRLEADCYMLIVHDNGKGFIPKPDYSQLTRTGHFGLVGMKERAEAIGGELIVTSTPGNGTTISVKVPLDGKNLR